MDHEVEQLYLRGDTCSLIAISRNTGSAMNDNRGAYRALRLLARLGDREALAFWASMPREGLSDAA